MKNSISKKDGSKMIAGMKSLDFLVKPEIILVYLGLKPVCEATVDEFDDIDEIKNIIKRLNLKFIKKEYFDHKWYEELEKEVGEKLVKPFAEYVISRDLKLAKKHACAKDDPVDHYQYGQLMGYPESAIVAFAEKKPMLKNSDVGKLMKKRGLVFQFAVPQEKSEESLDLLKIWSMAIKEYAPDLYNELFNQINKMKFINLKDYKLV